MSDSYAPPKVYYLFVYYYHVVNDKYRRDIWAYEVYQATFKDAFDRVVHHTRNMRTIGFCSLPFGEGTDRDHSIPIWELTILPITGISTK